MWPAGDHRPERGSWPDRSGQNGRPLPANTKGPLGTIYPVQARRRPRRVRLWRLGFPSLTLFCTHTFCTPLSAPTQLLISLREGFCRKSVCVLLIYKLPTASVPLRSWEDGLQNVSYSSCWVTCDILRDYAFWFTNNLICSANFQNKHNFA